MDVTYLLGYNVTSFQRDGSQSMMMRPLWLPALAFSLALPAAAVGATHDEVPRAMTLGGRPVGSGSLHGAPAIVLLWRSDCGPCLVELNGWSELQNAAQGGRLTALALEAHDSTDVATLARGYPRSAVWTSDEAPSAVLTRLGGAPPRLPLAVALKPDGHVCAVHHGILGTDRARKWIQQCS